MLDCNVSCSFYSTNPLAQSETSFSAYITTVFPAFRCAYKLTDRDNEADSTAYESAIFITNVAVYKAAVKPAFVISINAANIST